MTNVIIRAGSTAADCASQAQAAIAAGDYVSDLRFTEGKDKDGIGVNVFTVSFVKNNGHFAGFPGTKDKVTFTSTTGSLTQVQDGLAAATVYEEVLGAAIVNIGSPTTGSPTYHGIKAARTFDAA